ncbi:MAG: substrate-binding domain-containing protein [Lachnoclostridium sp.]|nr:substrate-binding domain-containing protein [Lachnoclostridium sp.]
MKRYFHLLLAMTMTLAIVTACSGKKEEQKQLPIAKIACDATFENILEQEIDVYEYIYPKEDVIAYYMDENAAIDSIMAMGQCKNAIITRPLTDQEVSYLQSHKKRVYQKKIAVDALALIVNPANPVEVLSKDEIAEILTGKVTRWDQVEPTKLGDINVIFDHQGSSAVKYMRDSVMGGKDFGPNVFAQKNNTDVFRAVASNKNAIGIIGVSWITSDLSGREKSVEEIAKAVEATDTTQLEFNSEVKVLRVSDVKNVNGTRPYQAYIFDGSYPLYRSVYMVSTAPGGTTSHRFYSFVTGFQGQKIIQMTGILPATVTPRMVEVE